MVPGMNGLPGVPALPPAPMEPCSVCEIVTVHHMEAQSAVETAVKPKTVSSETAQVCSHLVEVDVFGQS